MEGKNKFILYSEYIETFEALSDEDAGKLIKTIFQYVNDKDPKPEGIIKLAFIPIKQNLKRDLKQWLEAKKKMSEGAKNRWNTNTNDKAPISTHKHPKDSITTESVNVNVNVNDNVNVINKDKTDITDKSNFDKLQFSKNPFVNLLQQEKMLNENDISIIEELEFYFEDLFEAYPKNPNSVKYRERYKNVKIATKYIIPFMRTSLNTIDDKYMYITSSITKALNRNYEFDFGDFVLDKETEGL